MTTGHNLIDAAVKVCKSRYKLAKLVDVTEQFLSMVYSGKRTLGPVTAAQIAEVAGLDPVEAAKVAMIEGAATEAQRAAVERLFTAAGARGMLHSSRNAESPSPAPDMAGAGNTQREVSTLYIMSTLTRLSTWCRNVAARSCRATFGQADGRFALTPNAVCA